MLQRFVSGKKKYFSCRLSPQKLALVLCLLLQQAGLPLDHAPVKSYEIEKKVYDLSKESDQLRNSASYAQALNLLRQAATFDQTSYSPYIHVKMADCLREMRQYAQSEQECQKALKFAPDYEQAYYSLSLTNYQNEHYESAARYMRKLLQTSKDSRFIESSKAFLEKIETYGGVRSAIKEIDDGHLDKARQLLSAAARHDPSSASSCVHANLAYILRQSGKPEEAIEEGKKSLRYKPDDKEVIYGVAIACQDIGKFDQSIDWLQKYIALEQDPDRRKRAQVLIGDLEADKDKLDEKNNNLPDYLDHMVGAQSLHRWSPKSLPLKVHVSDGKGVKGFRSLFLSYIPRAMDTWSNASGNKLSYVLVDQPKDASIDIVWISEPILLSENGHKRTKQGLAHVQTGDDDKIDSVRVEIDTMNGWQTSKPLEDGACATVCLHELGHALGLGHSANYNDIMYFGASSRQTGLPTGRDRTTIARLYEAYPVSGLAPKEKAPPPMRFLPPPAFVPPAPPDNENLRPPVFLPPPIIPESEKLTPPFFQPPPLPPPPPPPLFMPAPLSRPATAQKKQKNKLTKENNESLPFFTPPPAR